MFLAASSLGAQTLPEPVIPTPPPPPTTPTQPTATPGEVEAPARPPVWEYMFGMGANYDNNVDFVPNAQGDAFFRPQAILARLFRSKNGQLRVRAEGNGFLYAEEDFRNRVDTEVGIDGARVLSANSTVRINVSGALGHTDSTRVLDEQGVLLPVSRTRNINASAALVQRLGVHSSLRITGRAYFTDFDQPVLVDSQSLRASLNFGRQMSQHDTLTLEYSLERAKSTYSYLTHYTSLQWGHTLSRRSALLFEGGVSGTANAAGSGLPGEWNFYGGASLARDVGHSTLLLFARREVLPTFGVGGLRLSDRFGVAARIPLGRAWELDLRATHVDRKVPEGFVGDQASGDEGSFLIRRNLGTRMAITAESNYRRRGSDGTLPVIDSTMAGVYFSFSSPHFNSR